MTHKEKYERKLNIRQERESNASWESLAKKYNLSIDYVKNICSGIEHLKNEQRNIKIEILLNQGYSSRQIGQELEIKYRTIESIINYCKFKLPSQIKRERRKKLYKKIMLDTKRMNYSKLKAKYGRDTLKTARGIAYKRIYLQRRKKKVARLLKKGYSTKQIVLLFKISSSIVSDLRTQLGINRPRLDGIAKIQRDKQVLNDLAKGMSRKEIEAKYKLTNVGMILKDYKFTKQ